MPITPAVDVFDLAAEFIAGIAGRSEPWEALLRAFASERDLTVVDLKELRRAVLRRRLFGGVAR